MSRGVSAPAFALPTRLLIKAVPGAKKDEIVGRLGDRLKVRVSAPPEGGKANTAICDLIAKALGVKARDVRIVSGQSRAEKTLEVDGTSDAAIADLFGA